LYVIIIDRNIYAKLKKKNHFLNKYLVFSRCNEHSWSCRQIVSSQTNRPKVVCSGRVRYYRRWNLRVYEGDGPPSQRIQKGLLKEQTWFQNDISISASYCPGYSKIVWEYPGPRQKSWSCTWAG